MTELRRCVFPKSMAGGLHKHASVRGGRKLQNSSVAYPAKPWHSPLVSPVAHQVTVECLPFRFRGHVKSEGATVGIYIAGLRQC